MSRMTSEIAPKSNILRVGKGRYDRATGVLTGEDGSPIHLRKQSAEVLAVLACKMGEVVSRDALFDAVWKDIATTDDSLIQCIGDIRRALGSDAIVTYPKVGYLLAATSVEVESKSAKSPVRVRMLMAACLFVLVSGGIGLWNILGHKAVVEDIATILPPRIVPEKTLAVLPFVNLGGGDDWKFFGDGLSEDLTTDLAKISDLTVIAYASSGDFATAERGFSDIANDLGVRYLVRGTVRHAGARVRINVALIDPYEGTNIWAERYDRVRQDPFDLQEDVTRAIVDALSLKLEAETASTRVSADAYFMLLRGLEPLRENTLVGNNRAREYFTKALELEPNYARAHAYTAVAFGRDTMFDYSERPDRNSIQKGLEAAVTAIQLEPEQPNAYFAIAILNLALGEYDKSLAAARHSIRLNRSFADGYAVLAEAGVYGGDLNEALEAIKHAKRLHPHHPASYDWIEGHVLFQLGDARAARPLLEKTIEATPGFHPAFVLLAGVYIQLGEMDRAVSVLGALKAREPAFSTDKYLASVPYASKARHKRIVEALETISFD